LRACLVSPGACFFDKHPLPAFRQFDGADGELLNAVRGNTRRYLMLFAEAADAVMPPPTELHEEDDVFDVLMRQVRTRAHMLVQRVRSSDAHGADARAAAALCVYSHAASPARGGGGGDDCGRRGGGRAAARKRGAAAAACAAPPLPRLLQARRESRRAAPA
jgi:hypothetical protein